MTNPYASVEEREFYVSQGKNLALELGAPESKVLDVFESEVHRMMAGARIKDFIPVIAAKRVREHFRSSTSIDRSESRH